METTHTTKRYLELRYGTRVRVEYVDLGEADSMTHYPEVLERIQEQSLPYPLVAVDGTLRLAGSAHYSHVLPLADEALASQGTSQAPSGEGE